jgi:transcriptional antiterminator RfaH
MIWSVAQTESSRERTAQRWLAQTGFETYLPVISGKSRARGGFCQPNPLFPGYLFVRIGTTGWMRVENTIGIVGLLRAGDVPARITDQTIAEIKARECGGIVRLPERPRWQAGDRVLIGAGSFFGQIGLFDGMSARERVFVLLNLFGRQTRVKLSVEDLRELN